MVAVQGLEPRKAHPTGSAASGEPADRIARSANNDAPNSLQAPYDAPHATHDTGQAPDTHRTRNEHNKSTMDLDGVDDDYAALTALCAAWPGLPPESKRAILDIAACGRA